jgi:DNA polymerase III epsilon subunit-like protein
MTTRKQRDVRIAYMDIETAPNLSWVWGKYEQNALDTLIPSYFLCFAWKWADEKKITTYALPDYPTYKKNKDCDKALVKDLWKLFDEADIIIAHNGDRFDVKKTYARFIYHGLKPPSPFQTIDTLKVARRHFAFDSNKLDDLGKILKVGKKLPHTGFHLWRSCMEGCAKAWKKMRDYNAQDVRLLELVDKRLMPWQKNRPDMRLFNNSDGCPVCESDDIQKRGYSYAKTTKRQRYNCLECGHWFSGEIIK